MYIKKILLFKTIKEKLFERAYKHFICYKIKLLVLCNQNFLCFLCASAHSLLVSRQLSTCFYHALFLSPAICLPVNTPICHNTSAQSVLRPTLAFAEPETFFTPNNHFTPTSKKCGTHTIKSKQKPY